MQVMKHDFKAANSPCDTIQFHAMKWLLHPLQVEASLSYCLKLRCGDDTIHFQQASRRVPVLFLGNIMRFSDFSMEAKIVWISCVRFSWVMNRLQLEDHKVAKK
jgi:hypothetical protein